MKNCIRILLCCAGLALCLAQAALAGEIRIGLMGPLTGSSASEGQDMRKVVELLAEEVNKAGGINGDTVRILTEDDAGDPRSAALAAQRLSGEKICAVIGTYGSAITEAAQGIYDEAGIVHIANGSTSVRLTAKGRKLFFRTCPRDDDQGLFMARAALKSGPGKIAILHDNSAYAKGLADEIKKALGKEGGGAKIVFFDAIKPKEQDYTAALTKIRGTSPDILIFTGYYTEAGMLLRQMREMKWSVPMLGGDATNNVALLEIAGKGAAGNFRFASPPLPGDLTTAEAKNFLAAYTAKHGALPSSIWPVLAGDAFRVLAAAVKAKGGDPKAIAAYLHGDLKEFPGFTGPISFDQRGDRVGDVYRLYTVGPDGTFVPQK